MYVKAALLAAKIVLLASVTFVIAKKAIQSTGAISVSNSGRPPMPKMPSLDHRCLKTAYAQNSVPIVAATRARLVGKSEATGYMCVTFVHEIVAKIVLFADFIIVLGANHFIGITGAGSVLILAHLVDFQVVFRAWDDTK